MSGSALDVQVGPEERPAGAVIVVVDGLGASYVYPEFNAYALDGSPLGKAVLFNLTGSGARAVEVRVPVPETTKSHSVLITGNSETDPQYPGPTIFDAVRERGYLSLAVLERGDSMPVLQEMDAVLYLGDNSMHGAEPTAGFRESAPPGLRALFQEWRDRFTDYSAPAGLPGYAGYDAWALDAAADVVKNLSGQRFVMLVNVGAVDSAGQNLGADGYLQTVQALDAPLGRLAEACHRSDALLVVTADHGMCFPAAKGKGGHSANKYSSRLEALRVPLVFLGAGVEELNLAGRWLEMDTAPTVLSLLNISSNLMTDGKPLPIREGFDLRVTCAPSGMELWRGEERLANASGDDEYCFRGLERGAYTIKAGGKSWTAHVSGDTSMDLAGKAAPGGEMKKIIGIILILAINLAGIAIIVRIWKKG
ncbi:2,3-bisphosphoglycerate-independent phosphoglycerate mutase [uncultured archaeon]|nr:2,3-bisphosphoglycerate-independent phosphoglycerate mutase [uncultured archaeon]